MRLFATLFCVLLSCLSTHSQDTTIFTYPVLQWKMSKQSETATYVKLLFHGTIPEGWEVTTEKPSDVYIPLKLDIKPEDSVFVKDILLVQTKGASEYSKMLEEQFKLKEKTARGPVTFQATIYFKKGRKPRSLSGYLNYWLISNKVAMPPQDFDFRVRLK